MRDVCENPKFKFQMPYVTQLVRARGEYFLSSLTGLEMFFTDYPAIYGLSLPTSFLELDNIY
jgi:hypothetical protein